MLSGQLIIGSVMIVLTAILHVVGLTAYLIYAGEWIRSIAGSSRFGSALLVLSFAVLSVFFLHTLEIWCWAVLYVWFGEFESLERALYFSTVTFTTLGYGDITLSPEWQLLSGFEAASGIILVGVSTAFIFAILRGLHAAIVLPGQDRGRKP